MFLEFFSEIEKINIIHAIVQLEIVYRQCFITVFFLTPNVCVILLVIKDENISSKKYLLNIFKLIKPGFYD